MLLYDSVEPAAIDPNVEGVAGYVDGIYGPDFRAFGQPYGWDAAAWARFSTSFKLRIAVSAATNDGHALDVEAGNALPQQAPGWVRMRRAAGVPSPWIYCNRGNRAAVETALRTAGIMTDQVALWIATLDGTTTVPAGPYPIAAIQWASPAISGGHFDVSNVSAVYGVVPGTIGGGDLTQDEHNMLLSLYNVFGGMQPNSMIELFNVFGGFPANGMVALANDVATIKQAVANLSTGGGLTPAQAQQLSDALAAIQRIEAALKAA